MSLYAERARAGCGHRCLHKPMDHWAFAEGYAAGMSGRDEGACGYQFDRFRVAWIAGLVEGLWTRALRAPSNDVIARSHYGALDGDDADAARALDRARKAGVL